MKMKKSTSTKSISKALLEGLDPKVPCAWHPDRKIRLSEYQNMINYFVQKYANKTTKCPVTTL